MTSDGISTPDWDGVHELALAMANASEPAAESEQLLLRAFETASLMNDRLNLREVALSLAGLYADERQSDASVGWLSVARDLMNASDDPAWIEYKRIERRLKETI